MNPQVTKYMIAVALALMISQPALVEANTCANAVAAYKALNPTDTTNYTALTTGSACCGKLGITCTISGTTTLVSGFVVTK
jgi:hypothetical protein